MEITFFSTILLGIVEGLTEFAPVSSTAHILLSAKSLGLSSTSFLQAFAVAIQSGAILAAIMYFWKTLWRNKSLIPKIIVGFIPTVCAGLLLHNVISTLFESTSVIGIALIVGGIIFLFLKPVDTVTDVEYISYKQAFIIGCTQIFAFIPGVSRSGATLIGGTLLRIPRSHIVTFSFLLGIPTILGASVFELQSIAALSSTQWMYLSIGTFVAFLTSLFTIQWFITILTKKPLAWFGWYRIIIGIVVLVFIV